MTGRLYPRVSDVGREAPTPKRFDEARDGSSLEPLPQEGRAQDEDQRDREVTEQLTCVERNLHEG